jgi:hypothetical protein
MGKRVADVLVETLQAAGVKRCYGIVGDTLNRIAYAIHESDIEWSGRIEARIGLRMMPTVGIEIERAPL